MDADVYFRTTGGKVTDTGVNSTTRRAQNALKAADYYASKNSDAGNRLAQSAINTAAKILTQNSVGDTNAGKTPAATTTTSSNDSGASSYDYASAVADAYQKMYDAQESARKAKQEALEKSNNESADRQIGLYNNQASRNRKQISDMTKGGTNGAMLSNLLDTELWRGNGIHNTINTRDKANAEGESASYDTYANNVASLASNLNNLMSSASSLDDDSLSKLRKRISEIYSNI